MEVPVSSNFHRMNSIIENLEKQDDAVMNSPDGNCE